MSDLIVYDPGDTTVTNRVVQYILDTDNTSWDNYLVNPDMSPVSGVVQAYWKVDGTNMAEMSQSEQDAINCNVYNKRTDASKVEEVDTNSTDWQGVLTHVDRMCCGEYRVEFSAEVNMSSTLAQVRLRMSVDGTEERLYGIKAGSGDYFTPISGFFYHEIPSNEDSTFSMDIKSNSTFYEVGIKNTLLTVRPKEE